ncbi:hypothetical protein pEaSNUABM5_00042 [Erwinia phage pEa_SNUABM_5]|uniref:Uncharacterized protein n=1 Tax=Erwinia phage pEa_SNUABM_5 TaxID=2797313 RepID=A0A7T8IW29_9CAUD|nr:hypothetical protein MPK73_gp042 [Erwinia phage pEa_SNUABM_5]QQO90184.1 hypothetical protein pEaSNUABM5_00042 [Erwinia phage pEa_SNUABM_5]
MMNLLLLDVLPEGCVMVMPVSDTSPPPLHVGFDGVFCDGYVMPNLICVAYAGMGRFVARQSTGKFHLTHLAIVCGDAEHTLRTIKKACARQVEKDRRTRIVRLNRMMVEELDRAEIKHPEWTSDAVHAAGILAEESGEAMQAAVDFNATGDRDNLVCLESETIQTGAMCLRLLLNLQEFRQPIDARTVSQILSDSLLDDAAKLKLIQKLIQGQP